MATPADRIGQTIGGKYTLTKVLGSGGMGAVYAANHEGMAREVALKVIPSDDDSIVERFNREARTLSKLEHPNTIRVFDFGRDEGLLYLAMEKLEGFSLEEALARYRRFSAYDAVDIARQVADSLTEAHELGIIHRDIKPANIFLTKGADGEFDVKVLDFGIAKSFTKDAETKLTREGSLVGTPRYMAPEQIRTSETDQRGDIYSLACVLYEMLAGRPPFLADNMADLLIQHLKESVPPLSRFVAADELRHIPPDLDSAVNRALSKDPRMRQKSMQEFCHDLALALGQIQQGPTQQTNTSKSLEFERPAPQKSAEVARSQAKAKKTTRRFQFIIGGLVAVLALASTAAIIMSSGIKTGDSCDENGQVVCGKSEFGSAAVLGCVEGSLTTLQACEATCDQKLTGGASCGPNAPIVGIEGGYCNERDALACDSRGKALLTCEGLVWVPSRDCGELKCQQGPSGIQCENNAYSLGDRCSFGPNGRACTPDFNQLVGCEDGTVVTATDCTADGGRCAQVLSGELSAYACYAFESAEPE